MCQGNKFASCDLPEGCVLDAVSSRAVSCFTFNFFLGVSASLETIILRRAPHLLPVLYRFPDSSLINEKFLVAFTLTNWFLKRCKQLQGFSLCIFFF